MNRLDFREKKELFQTGGLYFVNFSIKSQFHRAKFMYGTVLRLDLGSDLIHGTKMIEGLSKELFQMGGVHFVNCLIEPQFTGIHYKEPKPMKQT